MLLYRKKKEIDIDRYRDRLHERSRMEKNTKNYIEREREREREGAI